MLNVSCRKGCESALHKFPAESRANFGGGILRFFKNCQGGGFEVLGNVIVGIIGSFVGGWLFDLLGLSIGGEWLGPIVTATCGAIVLLFAIGLTKRK